MAAAGIETPVQLAKACGASRQATERWLKSAGAELSAEHLLALSRCLHVRMRWLMTGEGVPGWELYARGEELERVFSVLERLGPAQAAKWIRIGERMAPER